jgi:hypothetical protein
MGQVRPFHRKMAPTMFVRLADLSFLKPHQVAASRRPRTEARPRRKDTLLKAIDKTKARYRSGDDGCGRSNVVDWKIAWR